MTSRPPAPQQPRVTVRFGPLRPVVPAEPCDSVAVVVTFLRMDAPPADPPPKLPAGLSVTLQRGCTVAEYRHLYDTVGAPHLWWLRRTMPDHNLALLLAEPAVEIHVLHQNGQPAGFFELDRSNPPVVNLSYFGLMPDAVGQGFGYAFLRHAVATAWRPGVAAMTVNTCTADHPRAMATYLRAGFVPVRSVREVWNVPTRLGLAIPIGLRV